MRVNILVPLRYPLQSAALLVIIVFSALLWIAIKAGLLGIWLGILLVAGVFNYGFVLLERASIAAEATPLAVESMNPANTSRALVLLAMCGCFATAYHASLSISWWVSAFVCLVGCFAIPGMIAAQAVAGNALHALNLSSIVRLIRQTGSDYVQIVVILVVATTACAFAWSADVPLIVCLAVAIYSWLLIFAAIGCVIHEYREDSGLDNAFADDEVVAIADERTRERERARWLDRIYAQWRGGSVRNALQTIDTEIDAAAHPLKELLWLYQQVRQWPDRRLSEHVARPLLHRLLDEGRNGEALDIARAHLRINSSFRPLEGNDAIRLARLARDAGDRPTARTLLADFADIYPRDPAHTTAELLHRQLER